MLFDPNFWTEDELLQVLQGAKDSLMAGKSVVQWTSLGSSAQLQWDVHPLTALPQLYLALKTLNPDTYGTPVKIGRRIYTDYE